MAPGLGERRASGRGHKGRFAEKTEILGHVSEREQREALREVVDDETARGLDPAARCVMRYRVAKPRVRRS